MRARRRDIGDDDGVGFIVGRGGFPRFVKKGLIRVAMALLPVSRLRLSMNMPEFSRSQGTGIGLSIVKKAVERMGGTIELQSELGRGSVFSLKLRASQRDNLLLTPSKAILGCLATAFSVSSSLQRRQAIYTVIPSKQANMMEWMRKLWF